MADVQVRKYEPKDAAVLSDWCIQRGEDFNEALLPPNGFIASIDNEDVAAMFVYFVYNTPIAIFENLISNPKAGFKFKRALKNLIDCATNFVKIWSQNDNFRIDVIKVNVRSDMVKILKVKTRKNWIVRDAQFTPCYYLHNNE